MRNFESIFAAYMLGWGVFFLYQLSLGKRLADAEKELARLKEEKKKT
jgi:hypothetical protein